MTTLITGAPRTMLRVSSVEHGGFNVRLMPENYHLSPSNIFTAIVGKNGLGKSRLLSAIAKVAIRDTRASGRNYEFGFAQPFPDPVVIAASTSPFDKFPSPPRRKERDSRNYRYIGIRSEGMYASSSSISLMSSVTRGLLGKLLSGRNNANLIGVLNSLSFSPDLKFVFKPSFSGDRGSSSLHSFMAGVDKGREPFDPRSRYHYQMLSPEERSIVDSAIKQFASVFQERKAFSLSVDFRTNMAHLEGRSVRRHLISSMLVLMESGFVRLMDIRATKDEHEDLSLRSASSGEQCLVVLMLGIASYIEDGSLILIDEPEISLHPEWQEEFMGQLSSAFAAYRACQFIIATHSPQITSSMSGEYSFIYSLGRNTLFDASKFGMRSADYQLAELFDAPGSMNEYISRLGFNLTAKLRARKAVDPEIASDMKRLLALRSKLPYGDAIVDLVDSVEALYKTYG